MITPIAFFILIITTLGFAVAKEPGAIIGMVGSSAYIFLFYLLVPRLLLLNSKKLDIIEKLSITIKDFNPQFYLTRSIFSLPPKNICLSQEALDKLTKPELESLIMREIVQIKNGKSLEKFFWIGVSGPLSIFFFQELPEKTDYETARIIGDPETLANALEKIYGPSQRVNILRKL